VIAASRAPETRPPAVIAAIIAKGEHWRSSQSSPTPGEMGEWLKPTVC
jgi:hypothetical protein